MNLNPFTTERYLHYLAGLTLWFIALKLTRSKRLSGFSFANLILPFILMLLGTWIPDWDLIFGIGFHRSPLTHSIIPLILLMLLIKNRIWTYGFAIGLSSHLFLDVIDYGNVQNIPGRFYDRLFLFVNGLLAPLLTLPTKPKTNV